MVEEASIEVILRKIDETRNYLLEEINHNNLMSEKYKETCKYLNYVENLVILYSTFTGCANFCIWFISLCSCRYYELCNRIKDLCNHCRN